MEELDNRITQRYIREVIAYFSFFNYPPNFEEIYTFLKKKSSRRHLASILENMIKKRIIKQSKSGSLYTLPQYVRYFRNRLLRQQISQKKLGKIQLFLKILSWFPQIQLVGLSGTVAMMNASEKDDIDLFIITARNRLFTGRLIALVFAQLFGLRRKRLNSYKLQATSYADKVCLNLFFDESDLAIPGFKQTEYVAHEVLQMKPVVQKDNIYMRFIDANRWVFDVFPNSSSKFKVQSSKLQFRFKNYHKNFSFLTAIFHFALLIFNLAAFIIESIFKSFQLFFIKRHQTTEIITDTQLWFFPEDFELRLHGLTRIEKMDLHR